ncbi:MAG: transcription-repair coupling factor [Cellvibrionales bacterium]|nr:transcription-repair coupling factor [Cellvibrionales bacterium]
MIDLQSSLIPDAAVPTKAADKKYWCNLNGLAKGYYLAQQARIEKRFSLVVTQSMGEAAQLEMALRFFAPEIKVSHFPDWETLPYDHFSPHQDIISERIDTLFHLGQSPEGILFVPINTLVARIAPKRFIDQTHFRIKVGDILDSEAFKERLSNANYQRVNTVYEHGEFAIRGGIIDVFPMGVSAPIRIELFDDEVETIKQFDPETQRTIQNIPQFEVLPAKEFPLDAAGIEIFKDQWFDHFDIHLKDTDLYADLSELLPFAGIEYYLPLFFEQTESLLDYLPKDTLIFSTEGIESQLRQFYQEVAGRFEQNNIDRRRPLLPPETLFFREEEFFAALKDFPRIVLSDQNENDPSRGFFAFPTETPATLTVDPKNANPYTRLEAYLNSENRPILFAAESLGRKEVFHDIFSHLNQKVDEFKDINTFESSGVSLGLTVAPLDSGLVLPELVVISESQLFGLQVQQRRRKKRSADNSENIIKSLTELKIGAAVVHIDHGIGRYQGLKIIELDGMANEFLHLAYADDASLYVPVSSLHLISRYSGADNQDQVQLHKLGSDQWQKAKKKAAEKASDVAAELLDVYARRAARKGFSHETYTTDYKRFCSEFPFEETDDQLNAIGRVLEDMAKETPMDRLVCGDVGFGKTEVAMRAAFVAVQNSKQVAVLVPTTLLAQQHYESFKDRFAEHPISIEVLSRFKTAKEQQAVINSLEKGKIDILIGTHKILQSSIQFQSLGLVIIDEEHRFGVKQKEVLKQIRSDVDILAMTATPIPRTLNMSMAGIRDISIIATPPAKRLSIKTFVHQKDDRIIKEAVMRELLRGGQVYFLSNEVKTIENRARELQELLPEARIGIGHGQMRERELESVMSDFYHKRFNVLLCTTIIETGIDVPSANTIIIDQADKFGLAQLHQLRGRVGRSHHQAYAYLLTAKDKKLNKDAEKRLEAISEASDLGAGFMLATHDLEIRGAGELLGDGQSGHIQSIGYNLYMEMLNKAVDSIKKGETPNINAPLATGTEINLHTSAIIPEDYLPDVHMRLIMYKKIANCISDEELKDLKVEMIDRFGLLPPPLNQLFAQTSLKLVAEKMGINKIDASEQTGRLEFAENTSVEPINIVTLIQKNPTKFSFDGANRLKFSHNFEQIEDRINAISAILKQLK